MASVAFFHAVARVLLEFLKKRQQNSRNSTIGPQNSRNSLYFCRNSSETRATAWFYTEIQVFLEFPRAAGLLFERKQTMIKFQPTFVKWSNFLPETVENQAKNLVCSAQNLPATVENQAKNQAKDKPMWKLDGRFPVSKASYLLTSQEPSQKPSQRQTDVKIDNRFPVAKSSYLHSSLL